MSIVAELVFDEPRQHAFAAIPAVVRMFVPPKLPGVYMLLRKDAPFYVGRSDSCVQNRLVGHHLLPFASHVAWQPCANPLHAFRLESAWFHALRVTTELANQIHPARPAGEENSCPFCSTGDCLAWMHLMRPSSEINAASPVATDLLAVAAKT